MDELKMLEPGDLTYRPQWEWSSIRSLVSNLNCVLEGKYSRQVKGFNEQSGADNVENHWIQTTPRATHHTWLVCQGFPAVSSGCTWPLLSGGSV